MEKKTTNTDSDIWQSFKNGSQDAFHTVYLDHFKSLIQYGLRIINNEELVKDVIHDLFVKIWNNKSTLTDVAHIRSYLLVSLRMSLLNKVKQNNRIQLYEEVEQLPFEMEFSVESKFVQKEAHTLQQRMLIEALNQLSPRQKEVIYLRYFEELDYDTIASIMELTVKATYKLTARGIDALKAIMNISKPSIIILLAGLNYQTV